MLPAEKLLAAAQRRDVITEKQSVSEHLELLVSSGRVMSWFQAINHVFILKTNECLRGAAAHQPPA